MEKEQMKKVLSVIVESQSSTAPVVLSVGYTHDTNFVEHDAVVIKECPHATIEALQRYFGDRLILSMGDEGLFVDVLPGGK